MAPLHELDEADAMDDFTVLGSEFGAEELLDEAAWASLEAEFTLPSLEQICGRLTKLMARMTLTTGV